MVQGSGLIALVLCNSLQRGGWQGVRLSGARGELRDIQWSPRGQTFGFGCQATGTQP